VSDIIVLIRNERGIGMASVDGEPVIILLSTSGRIIDQQSVRLRVADAIFLDLPPGNYTVIARHPALQPIEARQDVTIPNKAMLGVKYFYIEAERQLLRVELDLRNL